MVKLDVRTLHATRASALLLVLAGCVSRYRALCPTLTLKFKYNDIDSCQKIFDQYPGEISCFLLEPLSFEEPRDGFLEKL